MAKQVLTQDVRRLVSKWRAIEAQSGKVDFDVAEYTAEVEAHYSGNSAEIRVFFWDMLGVRSGSKIMKFRRMAAAFRIVPDVNVWRAVGWDGVRSVARIRNVKRRGVACSRLTAERSGSRVVVGAKAIDTILAEVAPEVFVPASPVPETKKDREQARRKKTAAASSDTADLATLRAFFKRLVSGGYAFLLDQATDAERAALKLKPKPTKAQAS